MNSKYGQKPFDHAKQSEIDALKTSLKRVIWKRAEATGDLACNKIANWILKVSKNSQQNKLNKVSKTIKRNTWRKICIFRRNTRNYWWTKIKIWW